MLLDLAVCLRRFYALTLVLPQIFFTIFLFHNSTQPACILSSLCHCHSAIVTLPSSLYHRHSALSFYHHHQNHIFQLFLRDPYGPIRVYPRCQSTTFIIMHNLTVFATDAKRPYWKLDRAWRRRIRRAISGADREGWIYVVYEGWGIFKVGRTNDILRRRREWETGCKVQRIWLGVFWTPYTHRSGRCESFYSPGNSSCSRITYSYSTGRIVSL